MNRVARDFGVLEGRTIVRWVGFEMALAEDPVVWSHSSVPYVQCNVIDLVLAEEENIRLHSQIDDGSGRFGLYLEFDGALANLEPEVAGSICRVRELHELPVGRITCVQSHTDELQNVREVAILAGGRTVRLISGEVDEQFDGSFRTVLPDESILVQVSSADA